ncbi:MAG: right-handed parallel beta-helix repeat-containing protein, partial [Planctomycetota bacterium]
MTPRLIVIVVLALSSAAPGQIYVSTCGNDLWSGQSPTCTAPDGPKRTIQSAIFAVSSGTIWVAPGTYTERINFLSKPITLASSAGPATTIIDGTGLVGPVVTCNDFEGPDTQLIGFTITGGDAANGGGMYNLLSSPTVVNCRFIDNSARDNGGGMHNNLGGPTVVGCTFSGNDADRGGGMYSNGGDPTVINCVFRDNLAQLQGGGMFNRDGSTEVTNCAFSGNSAARGGGMHNDILGNAALAGCSFSANSATEGGGMYNHSLSAPVAATSILWGNTALVDGDEVLNEFGTVVSFSFCDVRGSGGSPAWDPALGTDDGGNIDVNPRFVDAYGPDGTAGTGDDDLSLDTGSPCIDAGDNTAVPADAGDVDDDGNTTEPVPLDLAGNPRFVDAVNYPDTGVPGNGHAEVVDMGAYEADASTPPADPSSDVGVYRVGNWYLDLNGNDLWDGGDTTFLFGLPDDVPVVGDWDGDGDDEVGVYRDGKWFLDINGNGQWDGPDVTFRFGLSGDVPVVGDWNGDGPDDVGVVRDGRWYLDLNGNDQWDAGDATFRFGLSDDSPVVGDWDGDGTDDVGVRRRKTW